MGRLIDADVLKKQIHCAYSDDLEILEKIDTQPTAYDPEKVVEQLEERTAFLNDCTKYGNNTAEQQDKSYGTMMMYEVKDLVDDLLEIVKGGGLNEV